MSKEAWDLIFERSVWATRGRSGSGCCLQGSAVWCGTTAESAPNFLIAGKNRALDGVVAFNRRVFEGRGVAAVCPADVPRTYLATGCVLGVSNTVQSCAKPPPAPFDKLSNAAYAKVIERVNWAAKGRSGSGCCVLSDNSILCGTTADAAPSTLSAVFNRQQDVIGGANQRFNEKVFGMFDDANNYIREKLQSLLGGPSDRQNVLAQYVEAQGNGTKSRRPPRNMVEKLAMWVEMRRARREKLIAATDLGFRFGPVDPGWASAFHEYIHGVAKLLPMWKSRTHVALRETFYYPMSDKVRIGVIGDWGTGNSQSIALCEQMVRKLNPSKFIHLGDIYYAGTAEELRDYFTAPLVKAFGKITARDLQGIVYNLPGNHDYYGGAKPFFDTLDVIGTHKGPYFMIHNAKWAIIGLDTALNDSDPAETAKGVKCTTLPAEVLQWAKQAIDTAKKAGKGVIVMSHHMLFSSHAGSTCGSEDEGTLSYTNDGLYNQFGDAYISKIDMWIWGHEHAYTRYAPYKALRFGYLLGNGGVPTYVDNKPYAIKAVAGQSPPKTLSPTPGYFSVDKGVTGVLKDFKVRLRVLFVLSLTFWTALQQRSV